MSDYGDDEFGEFTFPAPKPRNPLKEMSDEQRVERAIDESVEDARDKRKQHEWRSGPDYDPNSEPYGPGMSADMAVAESNDRLQSRDVRRMQIARPFGCWSCFKETPASEAAPADAVAMIEHWTGWHDPFGDPTSWRKVQIYCSSCGAD